MNLIKITKFESIEELDKNENENENHGINYKPDDHTNFRQLVLDISLTHTKDVS